MYQGRWTLNCRTDSFMKSELYLIDIFAKLTVVSLKGCM
jgi:hypothetical protein